MLNNYLIRLFICMVMTTTGGVVFATQYTILYLNTASVKIGNKTLKVGDAFSDTDISSISWISNKQIIKVRNEETKRTSVLTQDNVNGKETPSLKDYLVNKNMLATRDFSNPKVVQLLDSISFDISSINKDSANFIAVWHDGDYRVRTLLPLSDNGKDLYLTRSIYGHHTPRNARISILRYDLKKDTEPDSLGLLQIEILPFVLPY